MARSIKEPVPVTGIWLRKSPDHYDGRIEVLAEVDGEWRQVITYPNPHDGPISHIAEPAGIRAAPLDDLPATAQFGAARRLVRGSVSAEVEAAR